MKADTYAKLLVLESVIDADVGHHLEHCPPSLGVLREAMVTRISDLVDEIDALDAVTAARVYDAVVDFLAELTDDNEVIIRATLRLKRAVDRLVQRGMDERYLKHPSTWAIVLDELLGTLLREYRAAVMADGEIRSPELLRAKVLLARARDAADRMLWAGGAMRADELRSAMDRLGFAVWHQHPSPAAVEELVRAPQRYAWRHRPAKLTRIGVFVFSHLLRRNARQHTVERPSSPVQSPTGGSAEPRTA